MKPYSSDIRAVFLQLFIGFGLLWFLYTQLITPIYEPDAGQAPIATDNAELLKQLPKREASTQKIPEQFAEITRRPLFYSTRRPVETAKGVKSIEQFPSPDKKWTLTGTIHTGQQTVAIFSAKGNQNQTLSDGMKLEGWTIEEIQVGQVTLRREEQEIKMVLKEDPVTNRSGRKGSSSIFVNKEQYHNRIVQPM